MSWFKKDNTMELYKKSLLKYKIDVNTSSPKELKERFSKEFAKVPKPIKYDPVGKVAKIRDNILPQDAWLINMELRNGNYTLLNISTNHDFFEYDDGIYIVDDDAKYYMQSAQKWCLDYHQDFTLPIKRRIKVNQILKDISDTGILEVDKATNPLLIKRFIEKEVIQQAIKGAGKLQEELNLIKLLVVVTCILTLVSTIIIIKGSGMLSQIKLPF